MDAELHRLHAQLDEHHWWFQGRKRIIAAVLARYVPRRVGAVIDVGSGAGGLLSTLAVHGRVTAVEGEASSVAISRERHPEALIVHGEIPDALNSLGAAGLVTAFDVVEHLDDDVGALRAMAAHVDSGGVVCVTVPAYSWLWSSHDTANGHRRRYTARSLRAALARSGLEVVHLSYFNTLLFPVVALARLLERVRGAKQGSDFAMSAGPLDGLLQRAFASERRVVPYRRLPFGVSIIAVARPAEGSD